MLYQYQDDIPGVAAYGSRSLTPAEKNYHLHSGKLEFLALKWAICDQFRDYLYYAPSFEVYTDNNLLTYALFSAKLNATALRWIRELADFNFTIHYRPGKANIDADTVSNPFWSHCLHGNVHGDGTKGCPSGCCLFRKIPRPRTSELGFGPYRRHHCPTDWHIWNRWISYTQNRHQTCTTTDQVVRRVRDLLQRGQRLTTGEWKRELSETQLLLHEWDNLSLDKDGILRRRKEFKTQIIVPKQLRSLVLKELHENMGHLRVDRTSDLGHTCREILNTTLEKPINALSRSLPH